MKLRKLSIHAVLIGTTLPAEGSLERRIGAHPDIDLVESFTTREDAHEGVDELLSRRVFYALLDDVDAREGLKHSFLAEIVSQKARRRFASLRRRVYTRTWLAILLHFDHGGAES